MAEEFYIADIHFNHANVINFDNRPFNTVEEMDNAIISNWNNVVSPKDTVYIIGDFCMGTEEKWLGYLRQLKGKKILIKGNHDKALTPDVRKHFDYITEYKEHKTNKKRIIMCHYPIPFYRSDYSEATYMLYGHVHSTLEEDMILYFKQYIKEHDNRGVSANKCQFYNAWLGYYNYTPVTLDQIVEYWKNK